MRNPYEAISWYWSGDPYVSRGRFCSVLTYDKRNITANVRYVRNPYEAIPWYWPALLGFNLRQTQ